MKRFRNASVSLSSLWLFSLLFICTPPSGRAALFDGCDNKYDIKAGYTYLQSPYYPNYYPSSTSCRYIFTAPLDYEIQINCTIDLQKNANACSTEYFYVSTDGDDQLRGSEQFCGQGTLIRKSIFRKVVLAYASYGSYGRFQCQLYATPQPCDCGWSVNQRIVGGQDAGVNEYPSIVGLVDTNTGTNRFFCDATIISHRYLLTAAHCARLQPQPANILAVVGEHDTSISTDSQYTLAYRIQQIIEHPSYSSDPIRNDIALLLTTQNIEWYRGVGPICLPLLNSQNQFEYNNVDVIGWGTTSFGGPMASKLQKISLLVIKNPTCQQTYNGLVTIYDTELCTYDSTGKGKDSCQFDSGGPVIVRSSRQFLVGCISFGKVCGEGGYATGVNTRITSYLSWITQYTGALCQRAI